MTTSGTIFDNETVEKIHAFVEREAGRDAPLSLQDEAEVRQLLENDPAAQALADDFRTINEDLDVVFDSSNINVPDDLVSLVRTYEGTDTKSAADQDVTGALIPFPQRPTNVHSVRTSTPFAAAAAILALVSSTALVAQFVISHHDRLRYETSLADAKSALAETETELTLARVAQTGLRKRLAGLSTKQDQDIADQGSAARQFAAQDHDEVAEVPEGATETEATRDSEHKADKLKHLTSELTRELFERQEELEQAQAQLSDAEQQAAELEQARQAVAVQGREQIGELTKQLDEAEDQNARLESTMNTTLARIVALNTANDRLTAEKATVQVEASWLHQVAGYHRGYAGSMREVEITAEQQKTKQMLTKWLTSMMGRTFSIPALTEADLTFIGGRVFFVNGVPTGQIAYHDAEGRLTALCFTPSAEKSDSDLTVSKDDDLNLVSWSKQGVDYVMVGWADAPELKWISKALQKHYGADI